MPRMRGSLRSGQRLAMRALRGDKIRLTERIRTLETERNEALAGEQEARLRVNQLLDTADARWARALSALRDHPEFDLEGTDDEMIELLRKFIAESALHRGWEACETTHGPIEWRRMDMTGTVVRMERHPITPAGGTVIDDVLEAAAGN